LCPEAGPWKKRGKNGALRRTASRVVLVVVGPSGRSTSRKRGKGRVTTPTAQAEAWPLVAAGRSSRHRALDRAPHAPAPRDQSLHVVQQQQTRIFSVQYAARTTVVRKPVSPPPSPPRAPSPNPTTTPTHPSLPLPPVNVSTCTPAPAQVYTKRCSR